MATMAVVAFKVQPVSAATINAASCSQTAVQNAISTASDGDTVNVPAGNCTWSGLTINKAITLQGPACTMSGGTPNVPTSCPANITISGSYFSKSASGVMRIQNFAFTSGGESGVGGSWLSAQPIVFMNNMFIVPGQSLFRMDVAGGVIFSHNAFSGNWDNDFLKIKDSNNTSKGWEYADTIGVRDSDSVLGLSTSFTGYRNIYIEDNTFYGGANQGIDCDDNCRMVNRHNSFLNSESNSHGKDTSAYGMRHFEIYDNNFMNSGARTGDTSQIANENQAIWIRGGTGVIFNNTFDNLAGSYWGRKPAVNMSIRSDGWSCTPSYPLSHQLGQNYNGTSSFTDPIYLWNNNWNPGQGSGNIRVNASYGWGVGCGQPFSTYFQWGRDAVDNGPANIPKPGYAAYTYPHPLVSGNSVPTTPPPTTAPPLITSAASASGTAGSAFSYQITATNSPTAYGASGLPAGLSINSETGSISGTPTAAGTSAVSLSVTNSAGTGTATLTLTISPAAPPTVSITAPTGGSVSGTVAVSAIASSSLGIAGVQFKLDGSNLGAEVNVTPYLTSWDTTTVSNGTHTLTAVARDGAGNQTISAAFSVLVSTNAAATVSIANPTTDSTIASTVAVAAIASSPVVGVQFQIDGANLGSEVTTPPYQIMWNTSRIANGSHIVRAIARDNAGRWATSSGVTVRVSNPIRRRFSYQLTKTFTIRRNGGAAYVTTAGSALTDDGSTASAATSESLQIGYAGIQMDTTPSAPSGFAILGGRAGGVLVSETGVPAVSTMSSGRVYVKASGGLNTGIAVANPNSEDATISFYFGDLSGNSFGQGSFTLPAQQQMSAFLSQAPFNMSNFLEEGTFTFNSSVPVGVVAIQGFTNERREFLISMLPVASLGDASNNTTLLPHFADGGGWTTELVLTNTSDDPVTGTVKFFGHGSVNEDAAPLSLVVNGLTNSTFNYGIPPRSVVRLATGSIGDVVQTGSVRITPTAGNSPVAVVIFSFRDRGVTVSRASVIAAPTGSTFRMYAETSGAITQGGSVQSGVAIANPAQMPVTVNIALTQMDGSTVGDPVTLTIPAGGQVAEFVKEIFPSSPDNFRGFVTLTATSEVGVVSLRSRYNERGDFLITTTPPRNDSQTFTDSDILLPHVVSSGGYSSQFVIFGQDGSGGIYFNSADGTLMPEGSLSPVQ